MDHGARLTTMSSRIAAIAIDAVNPDRSRTSGALSSDGEWWRKTATVSASLLPIDVCAVPEGKAVKNRLHLDLRADGATTAEELERLLAIGAQRADVGQNPDVTWVVLSDPEGNEFCLLSRSVQDAQSAPKPAVS